MQQDGVEKYVQVKLPDEFNGARVLELYSAK